MNQWKKVLAVAIAVCAISTGCALAGENGQAGGSAKAGGTSAAVAKSGQAGTTGKTTGKAVASATGNVSDLNKNAQELEAMLNALGSETSGVQVDDSSAAQTDSLTSAINQLLQDSSDNISGIN